jgi:hypothetical protein
MGFTPPSTHPPSSPFKMNGIMSTAIRGLYHHSGFTQATLLGRAGKFFVGAHNSAGLGRVKMEPDVRATVLPNISPARRVRQSRILCHGLSPETPWESLAKERHGLPEHNAPLCAMFPGLPDTVKRGHEIPQEKIGWVQEVRV